MGTDIHESFSLSELFCEDWGSQVKLLQAIEPSHQSPSPVTDNMLGHTKLISSTVSSPVSVSSVYACPATKVTVKSASKDSHTVRTELTDDSRRKNSYLLSKLSTLST